MSGIRLKNKPYSRFSVQMRRPYLPEDQACDEHKLPQIKAFVGLGKVCGSVLIPGTNARFFDFSVYLRILKKKTACRGHG